jgi:type IV secretory pathway VirB9-like protein
MTIKEKAREIAERLCEFPNDQDIQNVLNDLREAESAAYERAAQVANEALSKLARQRPSNEEYYYVLEGKKMAVTEVFDAILALKGEGE